VTPKVQQAKRLIEAFLGLIVGRRVPVKWQLDGDACLNGETGTVTLPLPRTGDDDEVALLTRLAVHEGGHITETERGWHTRLDEHSKQFFNVLEDPRMERAQVRQYAGAQVILRRGLAGMLQRIAQGPEETFAGDPMRTMNLSLLMRAFLRVQPHPEVNEFAPTILARCEPYTTKEQRDALDEAAEELIKSNSSLDSEAIALQLVQRLRQMPPPEQQPQQADQQDQQDQQDGGDEADSPEGRGEQPGPQEESADAPQGSDDPMTESESSSDDNEPDHAEGGPTDVDDSGDAAAQEAGDDAQEPGAEQASPGAQSQTGQTGDEQGLRDAQDGQEDGQDGPAQGDPSTQEQPGDGQQEGGGQPQGGDQGDTAQDGQQQAQAGEPASSGQPVSDSSDAGEPGESGEPASGGQGEQGAAKAATGQPQPEFEEGQLPQAGGAIEDLGSLLRQAHIEQYGALEQADAADLATEGVTQPEIEQLAKAMQVACDESEGGFEQALMRALAAVQPAGADEADGSDQESSDGAGSSLAVQKEAPAMPDFRANLQGVQSRMVVVLQRELQERKRAPRRPSLAGGRVLTNRFWRLNALGDVNMFAGAKEVSGIDAAATLLVDRSGSMSGRLEVAVQAVMAFSLALQRLNVQTRVAAFPGSHTIVTEVQRFGEPARAALERSHALYPTGGTPMGAAMLSELPVLVHQRQRKKFMVIATDGQPDEHDHVMHALAYAEKCGVTVMGVGIGLDITGCIPASVAIDDVQALPQALQQLFRKDMLTQLVS